MKKILFIGILALACSFANAQVKNSIKVNPFGFFWGNDLITYERALGTSSSFVIGGSFGSISAGDYKYTNYGAEAQYRYYFSGEALRKFYLAPFASYKGGEVKAGDDKATSSGFGVGGRAGYQWVWNSGFTLDLNIGVGYKSIKYKWDSPEQEAKHDDVKGSGIMPVAAIALGYSF